MLFVKAVIWIINNGVDDDDDDDDDDDYCGGSSWGGHCFMKYVYLLFW